MRNIPALLLCSLCLLFPAYLTESNIDDISSGQNLYFVVFDETLSNITQQKLEFYASLTHLGITFKERFVFSEFFPGVSLQLNDVTNLPKLSSLRNVDRVIPVLKHTRPMNFKKDVSDFALKYPHSVTGVADTRESFGYKGKGIKVGIIDTGIDYTHPDLGGCFGQGCKVAYGYNFLYKSDGLDPNNPLDTCQGHGTHVAGIIAANGRNLTGVAPEATLGAYKVLPCEGNADEDVVIMALEKAYNDGMDVVNLSLRVRNEWRNNMLVIAATRATQKGMHIFASGGNLGIEGLFLVSIPALASEVTAAASFDNFRYFANVFQVLGKPDLFDYVTNESSGSLTLKNVQMVSAALDGDDLACSPFRSNSPLKDKVVLVRRGDCDFSEKLENVKEAGAIALAIYNSEPGPLNTDLPSDTDVPVFSITQISGQKLLSLIIKQDIFINFLLEKMPFDNPYGGKVSDFSSWGPGPLLEQKPDFGAPGGLIYSTYPVNKGSYATLSGTSMSSPYIAGAAAVYLEARRNTTPLELKDIFTQTAVPARVFGTFDYSPVQHQGAGMINLFSAMVATTHVSPSRIQLLSDDLESGYTRYITVKNTGDQELEYKVSHNPALSISPWDKNVGAFSGHLTMSNLTAAVKISNTVFRLKAGSNKTISLMFSKNKDIKSKGKILYGGYIRFSAQPLVPEARLNPVVQVTYSGMFGTYKDIPLILNDEYFAVMDFSSFSLLDSSDRMVTFSMRKNVHPTVMVKLTHPVKHLRVNVMNEKNQSVGYVPETDKSFLGRSNSFQMSPFMLLNWTNVSVINERGSLINAPNGLYKIRLELLGPFGTGIGDWQNKTSPLFRIDQNYTSPFEADTSSKPIESKKGQESLERYLFKLARKRTFNIESISSIENSLLPRPINVPGSVK